MSEAKIKLTSAGCVAVWHQGSELEVLMIYCKWENVAGWVFPKGTIEEGESAKQSAIRETIEETGYFDIEIESKLGITNYEFQENNQNYRKTVHWYLAVAGSKRQKQPRHTIAEKELIQEIGWHPLKSAQNLLLFENEKSLLDSII